MKSKKSSDRLKKAPLEVGLFQSAGKLKRIKRSGWIRKVGITKDCESVADHCFRLAILGMHFGLQLELDQAKIVRMCLIHDLAESEIGDLMPEDKVSETSHRLREDLILRKILLALPPKPRKRLLSDWEELINSETRESKLVWQLDKLEMYLQSKDYEKMGYESKELEQFQKINGLTDQSLRKIARLYPLTI